MLKTIIKMLTPFIISFVNVLNGVLWLLTYKYEYVFNENINPFCSHLSGSSLLVVLYIIVHSTHMCKYYNASCYSLLLFHMLTIAYIFTKMDLSCYIYATLIVSLSSLILWTVSVLGRKTYKTIHQACIREQTE